MPRMSRSASRRARIVAGRLPLPQPFDLQRFCESIAAMRGRLIVLAPLPLSVVGPCGLWLASDRADLVCYEADTSPLHQRHIVLHELGHMLCGHGGSEALQDSLGDLVPRLGSRALQIMLARQHSGYQERQEAEAEAFAYAIADRLSKRVADPRPSAEAGTADVRTRRLSDALEG